MEALSEKTQLRQCMYSDIAICDLYGIDVEDIGLTFEQASIYRRSTQFQKMYARFEAYVLIKEIFFNLPVIEKKDTNKVIKRFLNRMNEEVFDFFDYYDKLDLYENKQPKINAVHPIPRH